MSSTFKSCHCFFSFNLFLFDIAASNKTTFGAKTWFKLLTSVLYFCISNKSTNSSEAKKSTHVPKSENKYPKRYIDEPLGTREDSKKMYGRQGAINRSNKN